MQIYSVARNVLGALGPRVKVPVLDSELKIPAECLRIVGALDAGSIIEQGSNANGRYTKWADGTMLCWQVSNLGTVTVAQNDNSIVSWAFPAAFVTTVGLVLLAQPLGWAGNRFVVTLTPQSTTYAMGGCYSITGTWELTGGTSVGLYAVGRWKA